MCSSAWSRNHSPERRTTGGLPTLPADYPQFLAEIKVRIAGARTRAALAVNSELVRLYWEIGHEILDDLPQFDEYPWR